MGADASKGGRAAWVTGASSGIGLAIAEMLAEEGYDLTLASRTQSKLEAAAARPAFADTEGLTVPIDVGDTPATPAPAALPAVVGSHRERFGRLDVLVNNAGLGVAGELAQIKDKHIDLQLNV